MQQPAGSRQAAPKGGPSVHYLSFSAPITPVTMQGLLAVATNLANQRVPKVYLLLSTPGGSVACGLTLYNTLRAMPFHLITHNVGNVDSIGIMLFLAGDERYSYPHTTFMFHGVGFDIKQDARFEEKQLMERLDGVRADQKRIGDVIAERTSIPIEEVEQLFLQAQTRDPQYALDRGIIHEIREVSLPAGGPVQQLVFKG